MSDRQRLVDRDKVQQELLNWIEREVEIRLKNSLYNRVAVLLGKNQSSSQIISPWEIDVKIGDSLPFRLPSGTAIASIYDREDVNGRLLIMGAPGGGKTTTLLQLAQVLVNRAKEDISRPIPLLLNLSSWKDDKQGIGEWIIETLTWLYGLRSDIAKNWIDEGVILPLLDGLDELASERQEICVQRLNQFLALEGAFRPLVVCSRDQEYQLYQTKLGLNASVMIQLLSRKQIRNYVLQTEGEKLWNCIKNDGNLMALAEVPLLLNMLVICCQEISFDELATLDSLESSRSYLLDVYLRKMLARYYNGDQPPSEKTIYWLAWLANQLCVRNQTDFLIQDLQPYWLKSRAKRVLGGLISGVLSTLILGVIGWLWGGLLGGLFGDVMVGLRPIDGMIGALITGLLIYVIGGALEGLLGEKWTRIVLVEIVNFKWSKFLLKLAHFCIAFVSLAWLMVGLKAGLAKVLVFAFFFGLADWFINWLAFGVPLVKVSMTSRPNQAISKSLKLAVKFSVISWVFLVVVAVTLQLVRKSVIGEFILVGYSEIMYIMNFMVWVGLDIVKSWRPAIKHFSLRVILWFSGYAPWNYARFLDYVTNRLFVQRVGGGYCFLHRLLQEHFAQY